MHERKRRIPRPDRIGVLQEAQSELLDRYSDDADLVSNACEWWRDKGGEASSPPEEFVHVVRLLDEYADWRGSKTGQLRESSRLYHVPGIYPSPFQQFLRERDSYDTSFPAESGPRLEHSIHQLVGDSKVWRDVAGMVQMAAFNDAPILIGGEVGTGKSRIARVIHETGMRSEQPFLQIPCPYLSHQHFKQQMKELVSEHVEIAENSSLRDMLLPFGTVFFSEIDQLPIPLQPLIADQVRRRYSLREKEPEQQQPRFIASTTEDLSLLSHRQLFRHDLYLEIAIFQIDMPPLRHRRTSILPLANHLLEQLSSKLGREKPVLHEDAARKLVKYNWPGNLAELRTVLDAALVKSRRVIRAAQLHFEQRDWMPISVRDQEMIVQGVQILQKAGFQISTAPTERLVAFLLRLDNHQFKNPDLAEELKAAPSTTRNYLSQLRKLGFVQKHGDRKAAKWSVNQDMLRGRIEPGSTKE